MLLHFRKPAFVIYILQCSEKLVLSSPLMNFPSLVASCCFSLSAVSLGRSPSRNPNERRSTYQGPNTLARVEPWGTPLIKFLKGALLDTRPATDKKKDEFATCSPVRS